MISRSHPDWRILVLGMAAFGLALTGRVKIVVILLLAAAAGYLLYSLV